MRYSYAFSEFQQWQSLPVRRLLGRFAAFKFKAEELAIRGSDL